MLLAAIALALFAQGSPEKGFDPGPSPYLMRHPTVNASEIVFEFAGDLWSVPRSGGDAIRLTSSPGGSISNPFFSPDGTQIAFSADYDGNTAVYVMPASGGTPKRLTASSGADQVTGWTPDGTSVVFSSNRQSNTDYLRLYTVSMNAGTPKALPFPAGVEASFSPDGAHIALVPNPKWELAWKRYRGGQTTPIWVGDLATSKITPVPRHNTNDFNPMWVGNAIYYLSDPTGPVGMNRYDVKTGKVTTVVPGEGFDLKSASAGPGVIAYEKLGSIHLYNLASGEDHPVRVHIVGDFPAARTEFKDLRSRITSFAISPSGKRAVVCARGWVLTVPAEKGDIRILDDRQGFDRTDAAWSPDGKTIAYICDEGKGEHLALYDLAKGTEQRVALGDAPADYSGPVWSPDSKKIAYTDNKLNLWVVDASTGANQLIDTGTYRGNTTMLPRWSPDSKWLTWSRDLESFVRAIFVYSFDSRQKSQITDGLADALLPVFDRSGKYIYFTASTDEGFGMDYEDLEAIAATNSTSTVYAILLRKDLPDPLQPESDEEKPKEAPKKDEPKPAATKIDLAGIQHRIIALPLPRASYDDLVPGPNETLFALSRPPRATAVDREGPGTLQKFAFADRKVTPAAENVEFVQASTDGEKLLLRQGRDWRIVSSAAPGAPGGKLDLADLRTKIDPPTEWTAMYHQAWRKERMLFYDPGLHGIDSYKMEKRYEPFLANLRSRGDLNYLFTDMLGEICIGHMFIGGGDIPERPRADNGVLGADFSFENGKFRLTRVYDGESWNPELHSPLGAPGVNAVPGEYLLSIDGKDMSEINDVHKALEGQAGRQIRVRLGPTPDGVGARNAVVVPLASDFGLREAAWAEDNRRYVERETGGRGGYVHVPDTGAGGYAAFMRYYYAQEDKDGMIVDDRFNHGGAINDFMVREMEKPLDFFGATRYGKTFKVPMAAIYGPKVMLINEMAGSGGDLFPYLFRQHHVGKLVGHKTWGGELSAYGFPLIDGGTIRAPDDAEFDPTTGQYVIDNVGVAPDIEVELDPAAWRKGVDSQLQAAVEELKKQMAAHPPMVIKKPPYPDKTKLPDQG
jgi:tricorn protease